jgi:hypothetical protein
VRPRSTFIVFILSLLVSTLLSGAQKAPLPEISWTCPMHPDVVEGAKGKCPICKMNLVPVRLESAYSCPVHSVIDESREGKCPICRRDLVRVTVALSFTCRDRLNINQLNPGKCRDGSAMIPRHTPRAHGNHNPQHGGMFFMASDSWHHLEGTLAEEGVFRLYVYDDFSKPLAADQMKLAAAKGSTEVPLKLAADGKSLEAKIDGLKPPAELVAKVKFKRTDPDFRFDFVFPEFSTDRAAAASAAALAMPQLQVDIPDKTSEILSLLAARNRDIREMISKGMFGEIYVSAFQAKELALALEFRLKELPPPKQSAVMAALERVVRSAWQLDNYGDLGDRALIDQAYAAFAAAVQELQTAFTPGR